MNVKHPRRIGKGVSVDDIEADEQKGIQGDASLDQPVVHADGMRLQEVVQNLIESSVKYMGDQSQPRIEVGMGADGNERVYFVQCIPDRG